MPTLRPRLNLKKFEVQVMKFYRWLHVLMTVELLRYYISEQIVLGSIPSGCIWDNESKQPWHAVMHKIFKHLCTKYVWVSC